MLTNRALAKQAEADMRLKQTAAQGQNLISIKTAEFQAQITGINAQRDLDQRSRRAEADLLVRQAEAQGTELINRAACTPHQTGATEVGIRFNKITRASSTSPVRSTTSAASYSWCSRSASIAAAASTMKPKTA
ncbi:MAG TPA: hypothetical protein VEK79_10405 [Thermoanaerobaculia bacterium]|nr:hypothetical protein [Thermoanaerobaculia bacterium]